MRRTDCCSLLLLFPWAGAVAALLWYGYAVRFHPGWLECLKGAL